MSATQRMYGTALVPRVRPTHDGHALSIVAHGARATGRALRPYAARAGATAKALALLALLGAVGILRARMARSRVGRATLATVRVATVAWRSVA